MKLPYAEQLLMDAKSNQWFIQFNVFNPNFDMDVLLSHVAWMQENNLTMTEVCTINYMHEQTHFYHVPFTGESDARLTAYSEAYELPDGSSKYPEQYQMYEWSYQAWTTENGLQLFMEHLKNNTGVQGPQGP